MSKARFEKKLSEYMYNVNSVPEGFDYWFYKLLNYCLQIFRYKGLPDSLPGRELLMNLIITGHSVIFENKGELITARTTIYDFDLYYRPTKATYGNPVIKSRTLEFGKDAEIVYLTRISGNVLNRQAVDSGLITFIKRYARMLADIESTISIYTVNSRFTAYPVGGSDQVRQSLENFYNQISIGKKAVITDDVILESFRNVDIVGYRGGDKVNDWLIARDKVLSMFFRDIGVKFQQEQKKAQLTEDEVEADEQLLLLNVKDMLEVQQEGLDRVNKHWGTGITVELNPAYDRTNYQQRKEVEYNDNTENNG